MITDKDIQTRLVEEAHFRGFIMIEGTLEIRAPVKVDGALRRVFSGDLIKLESTRLKENMIRLIYGDVVAELLAIRNQLGPGEFATGRRITELIHKCQNSTALEISSSGGK